MGLRYIYTTAFRLEEHVPFDRRTYELRCAQNNEHLRNLWSKTSLNLDQWVEADNKTDFACIRIAAAIVAEADAEKLTSEIETSCKLEKKKWRNQLSWGGERGEEREKVKLSMTRALCRLENWNQMLLAVDFRNNCWTRWK